MILLLEEYWNMPISNLKRGKAQRGTFSGLQCRYTSSRWMEAAMGASVSLRGDTIWVEPYIRDYDEICGAKVTEENPWVRKLCQLTDELVKSSNGRYPVAANEFMSPLTALVELRGNTNFGFDLYDQPSEIKKALSELNRTWSALLLLQYKGTVKAIV